MFNKKLNSRKQDLIKIDILHLSISLLLCFSFLFNTPVLGQNLESVKKQIAELNSMLPHIENDTIMVSEMTSLGQRYRFVNIDSSKYFLWKVLHLHRKLDVNNSSRVFGYNVIANIYRLEPNVDSAMFYYEEAYDFFTKTKRYKSLQGLIAPFASFLAEQGEIDRSIAMFHGAIDFAKQEKNYLNLAFLYRYLGQTILQIQKDEERAIELLMEGIAASEKIKLKTDGNYERAKMSLFIDLSDIYLNKHQADSAIFYAEQAADLGYASNILQIGIRAYNNISYGYILKEAYSKAKVYNEKATQLSKTVKNTHAQIQTKILEQLLHLKTGNYGQCIYSGKTLLNEHQTNIKAKQKVEVFEYLCECYILEGIAQKALEAKDSFSFYTQKTFDINQTEYIAKLDKQYQVSQKETENQLLKVQKEIADKTVRSRTTLSISAFTILLLLAGWSFFIYKNNIQRKRLNEQLEIAVNERTTELQMSNKNLQQANYELQTFNHIASHDLKEPIRVIGNYAGLIRRKLPNDIKKDLEEYFELIKRSSSQLYTLIEDFAHYTALSHNSSVIKDVVNLNETLEGIELMLYPKLEEHHGKIINNGLPSIYSNSSFIYTILKNLIENGIKFNESPIPIVELSYEEIDTYYRIIISDNGIGIEEEYHEKIFEMFKRLHNRNQYVGSGIGLSIVKLLVEKLDGTIQVQSAIENGTTFILDFPKERIQETT
jgi:signal transduction histidine kinase